MLNIQAKPVYSPSVGDGATEICWSDRHAYTIVEVVSPKCVVVQQDTAKRKDYNGMSECQDYDYSPNFLADRITVTQRSNGRWVTKGQDMKNGQKFILGFRSEYYDYSF